MLARQADATARTVANTKELDAFSGASRYSPDMMALPVTCPMCRALIVAGSETRSMRRHYSAVNGRLSSAPRRSNRGLWAVDLLEFDRGPGASCGTGTNGASRFLCLDLAYLTANDDLSAIFSSFRR